jgi:hypothetical protein
LIAHCTWQASGTPQGIPFVIFSSDNLAAQIFGTSRDVDVHCLGSALFQNCAVIEPKM